jgi:hypothetical protein
MVEAVHRAATTLIDPKAAAAALVAELGARDPALVLFFCAPRFAVSAFAAPFAAAYPDACVIGCTGAGEIGPAGYADDGVTAVAFEGHAFHCAADVLEQLDQLEMSRASQFAVDLADRLAAEGRNLGEDVFGFMLIDGLSTREELVASCIGNALDGVPLFGGSAADRLTFTGTAVFARGRFHRDAAVLVLIETRHSFRVFRSQNFVAGDRKLVVTDADAPRRLVREFNAAPAVEEYARVNELAVAALDPTAFATHPLVVKLGGAEYVRAVQQAHPDGSLSFYAKIDEGLVLTTADERDVLDNLNGLFDELRRQLGPPLLVLAFDSILRRLHLAESGTLTLASQLMRDNAVVGFNTFGEQFAAMHVNQTFTGVAIGRESR